MQLLLHCCCCCSAAAAAAAVPATIPAADPGQDNSLLCHFALAWARTRDWTIGTSQPTTLPSLGRTCLTRPSQDSVAASLSLVWALICSSDEDLLQTGRIHPDCQSPATGADYNLHSLFKGTVQWDFWPLVFFIIRTSLGHWPMG